MTFIYSVVKTKPSYLQAKDIRTNIDYHEDMVCRRPKSTYRYGPRNINDHIVLNDAVGNKMLESTVETLLEQQNINELKWMENNEWNRSAEPIASEVTPGETADINKFPTNVYLPATLRDRAFKCVTNSVSDFFYRICSVEIKKCVTFSCPAKLTQNKQQSWDC